MTASRARFFSALRSGNRNRNDVRSANYAAKVELLAQQLAESKRQRAQHPKRLTVAELPAHQKLDVLPIVPRQLLDIIRMIAYRAETVMMPAVFQAQGKKRNARKLLRQLFQCEANLIPQPERGLLRVQFLGLASDCTDRAMPPLIEQLNATRT